MAQKKCKNETGVTPIDPPTHAESADMSVRIERHATLEDVITELDRIICLLEKTRVNGGF